MKKTNQKQLWPKTPLQWLGVLILLFLAYSAWEAAVNTTKDPFPELTESNRRLERTMQKLNESYEDLHKK